jgi:hypothetical protein
MMRKGGFPGWTPSTVIRGCEMWGLAISVMIPPVPHACRR